MSTKGEGSPRQRTLLEALRPRLLELSDEDLLRAIKTWMRRAQERIDTHSGDWETEEAYGMALGYRWRSWDSERIYADLNELTVWEPQAEYDTLEPDPAELRERIARMNAREFDHDVIELIWQASGREPTNIEPFPTRDDEVAFYLAEINTAQHPAPPQIDGLFTYLRRKLPDQKSCDGSLRWTERWMRRYARVYQDEVTDYVAGHGGTCDCEVLLNVLPAYQAERQEVKS